MQAERVRKLAEWMGLTCSHLDGIYWVGEMSERHKWNPERIQDAWMLALKAKSMRLHVEVVEWVDGPASCSITSVDPPGNIVIHQWAETAPEAICGAIEKLMEVKCSTK